MKQSLITVLFATGASLIFAYRLLLQVSNVLSLSTSVELPLTRQQQSPRLEFVNYSSSSWEQLWLNNVDKWIRPDDKIRNLRRSNACRQLLTEQAHYVHDFLNLSCTTRFPSPYQHWCRFDDYSTTLYYNTSNRDSIELSFTAPTGLDAFLKQIPVIHPKPVIPSEKDEHVFSKFVFRDSETGEELVEYIEPLVSHLRFPLCGCWNSKKLSDIYALKISKGYIIPPSPSIRSSRRRYEDAVVPNRYHKRYLYFDAGASSWTQGLGGASLEYFANVWQRHGIVFDEIYAFEATTSRQDFYQSIPSLFWSDRTVYQQSYVSSRLADDAPSTPFIPKFIQNHATIGDYVVFKLDIDSPGVEEATIEYLVDTNGSDTYLWIDELFWEHHVYDNPFMRRAWYPDGRGNVNQTDSTMRGSYNLFLKMRKLGIRAHSWV